MNSWQKPFTVIYVRFDEKIEAEHFSTFVCGKFVIDIALKENMADYPLNAINIPISQKRKRGRPLGSQSFYMRQPLEKLVQRNESATDTSSSTLSPSLKKKQKDETDVLLSTSGIQSNVLPSTNETQTKSKLCESTGSIG